MPGNVGDWDSVPKLASTAQHAPTRSHLMHNRHGIFLNPYNPGLCKKIRSCVKNNASNAKSCPEHIPWLSMCQLFLLKKYHKNCVKKHVTKNIYIYMSQFEFSYNFGFVTIWIFKFDPILSFEFCPNFSFWILS